MQCNENWSLLFAEYCLYRCSVLNKWHGSEFHKINWMLRKLYSQNTHTISSIYDLGIRQEYESKRMLICANVHLWPRG